ncbi:galactoside O-acetyltransferase [bacterium BMS3Bbin11]|nr:galactoside O-acetyltransferase [bacterium BMS3Bbin11]HDH08615.1 acyltransferase [Gammaproteobacteria bacterium]
MTTKSNKTHKVLSEKGSALSKYQHIIVGDDSWLYLFYFEFCALLGKFPGALGILLRKLFWPHLFGSCGKGVMFADNIVLRQPKNIHLGNNVIISEFCVLDARHDDENKVITLADDAMLSTNIMISCKNACISVGKNAGLGAQTIIHATNDCSVSIGDDVIIGPQSYISAGGNYHFDQLDIPIREQGINPDGGITLQNNIWLGAKVTVLGGVTMESGSIAGAGAVVNKSIPANAICAGVPAKVIKTRK